MKKHNLLKKIISISLSVLSVSGLILLSGCGSEVSEVEETIELIEPASETVSSATAEYRTLYSSASYAAICSPKVTEYSFSTGTNFSKYGAMPGNEVKSGEALMVGNLGSLEDQIKSLKETIQNMDEDYEENLYYQKQDLWKANEKVEQYEGILKNLEADLRSNDPNFELNDDYQYRSYDGMYRAALISLENLQLSMKRNEELYQLDRAYQVQQLNNLQDQCDEVILYSDVDGVVVSELAINKGTYLDKGQTVAAVGDMNSLEIRCEFINQGELRQAQDVYAVINGKRYEVDYRMLDADTYDRLKSKNDVVFATFTLQDSSADVNIGDFATIIVVKDCRNNVLCVPKDAVNTDENGSFVYIYDGEYYEKQYVHVGMTEGAYTEILSGLNEGDQVKSDYVFNYGNNEYVITYGNLSSTFEENGYLFYPTTEWVKNEIEYGTVYVDEVCVSNYQQVTKGQVLLKVHVVADTVEMDRLERKIYRQQQRVNKLVKEDENRTEKQNERSIKNMNKNIAELQKKLNEMKEDAACTEIVSPIDGVITELVDKKVGDLSQYNSNVANIADQTKCFVLVEDSDGRLSYGNEATISYKDQNGAAATTTGMVVSANPMSISKELKQGYALISVPEEAIASMAGSTVNIDGWWNRNMFKVSVKIRSMENVLTVPKRAVKDVSGTTYVAVKQADGTVKRVSFVAGGSDATNYWIAEGLTEGMTICLE